MSPLCASAPQSVNWGDSGHLPDRFSRGGNGLVHIRPLKLCLVRRSVRTCQFRNSGETEQGWVRDQSPGFPGGLEPRFSRLGSHEPVARAVNTDLYTVQSSRGGRALPRAGSCLIFIERGIRVSRKLNGRERGCRGTELLKQTQIKEAAPAASSVGSHVLTASGRPMTVGLVTPRACASRTAEGELSVLPAAGEEGKGRSPPSTRTH